MIRIGILEFGITCALVALAIVIPLIITRGYARLNDRLKRLEDRLKNKGE
jgi:hypothetical protein